MPRCVVGLLVGLLLLLASGRVGAAPLSGPDRRARAEAQRLLERSRSPEHRALYRIVVPAIPSRLPERYTILHHANHIAFLPSSRVIHVERDARGAHLEQLDAAGIARATVPGTELDALVRLGFYLQHARTVSRDDAIGMDGFGYASHMPLRQLAIEGEDEGERFSLITEYAQPIQDELSGPEVERFAQTVLVTRFEALVDAHVDPEARLELDAALLADVERRLRAIPRGTHPLSQYDREDHDAVVARLLAHYLVGARVDHVLPLLRRKGLDEQAYALSLAITPVEELAVTLPGLLCSDEHAVHHPALALAIEHREESREAMRYALGCRLSNDKVVQLLRELARAPAVEGAPLRELHPLLSAGRSAAIRHEAARTLWIVDHDVDAERRLRSIALQARGRRHALEEAQVEALSALEDGTPRRSPAAHALADLALELLQGQSMDLGGEPLRSERVLSVIALHGGPRHGEPLLPWLDHPDPRVVAAVVDALASLDPDRARAAGRERLQRYVRGVGRADYAHAVEPFVLLWVRGDEAAPLEELRAAEERLRVEAPRAHDPRRRVHAALVGYLDAAPATRADAALRLIERMPDMPWPTRDALIERHALDPEAVDRAQAKAQAALTPVD